MTKSWTHFACLLIAIAGLERDASIVRTNRTIHDTQDDLTDLTMSRLASSFLFCQGCLESPKGKGTFMQMAWCEQEVAQFALLFAATHSECGSVVRVFSRWMDWLDEEVANKKTNKRDANKTIKHFIIETGITSI